MGLAVHNGKTSNSEVPIDEINIEIFGNITDFEKYRSIQS